jgi:two-component system, response regulator YesN
MYKVLLVDDEPIIREGIAAVIDWESYEFLLTGTARNGLEAYAMIIQDPPHIVITDIKMPGLNGLELIAKVKAEIPDIQFIVLSGYGEFELAKQAMHYGVKHYLLKPCNENKIVETLQEVKQQLRQQEEKEASFKKNSDIVEKVLPRIREQFLRDFITNRNAQSEYDDLYDLLNIQNKPLRLILFRLPGELDYQKMVNLKQCIHRELGKTNYFSTIDNNLVITLAEAISEAELADCISRVIEKFFFERDRKVSVGYSNVDYFENTPLLYKEVQDYLQQPMKSSMMNYGKLVQHIIKVIYENIANEELSLKWLAVNMIFMNEGYLSKQFVKETGEKFSHYLTRIRMEKAKVLLKSGDDNRVSEVAQQVGYGNNPQYFSQLFKKYTGLVPSEYHKGIL